MNREATIRFLEEVRAKKLCSYIGTRCDCKYGAHRIGSGSEEGNGCPEMYCLIQFFKSMTDKEFVRLDNKARKQAPFFYKP